MGTDIRKETVRCMISTGQQKILKDVIEKETLQENCEVDSYLYHRQILKHHTADENFQY